MGFDMAVVEATAPAPIYTTIEPKAAVNNEVAQDMHILTTHIKQQDEKIAHLEDLITKQANTPTTPHPINTAAGATATDKPKASTHNASTILTSVYKARIVQMEIQLQTKFDTLLQAMAFMNAKMDTIMDNSTKRDHNGLSTTVSSLDQASKKTDNQSTPTKPPNPTPRPSLGGAEKNLFS
jgi:hypothetical protein